MVFVTVGNATQGFRRLLDAVEDAAASGLFSQEEVFIQSGNNPQFRPIHCRHEAFIDMQRFENLVRESSLVVSHAGAGTLLNVFRARKIPVVMPRQKVHGELIDDHQLELVNVLAKEGRLVPVYEATDLAAAVREARHRNLHPASSLPPKIIGLVAQAIEELSRNSTRDAR